MMPNAKKSSPEVPRNETRYFKEIVVLQAFNETMHVLREKCPGFENMRKVEDTNQEIDLEIFIIKRSYKKLNQSLIDLRRG